MPHTDVRQRMITERQARELARAMGDNYRSLGQHANAVKAYRRAVAAGGAAADTHLQLIRSLFDGRAGYRELEGAVAAYVKAFPGHRDRYEARSFLPKALMRDGDAKASPSPGD